MTRAPARFASPSRRALAACIVPAAYLVLALVLTWPLVLHPGSAAPGLESFAGKSLSADTWNQVWSLWWVRHVVTGGEGDHLYFTRHLFYPTGTTLAFHTLCPLYGVVTLPLQLVFGPVVAWNVLLWALLALAGWTTFLLVRRWTGAGGPSFLAGAAFAFSPYVTAHLAAGHLNLAAGTVWLPLYLLFFLRAVGLETRDGGGGGDGAGGAGAGGRDATGDRAHSRARLRHAGAAGLVLAATAYADLYYVAFLLVASALALVYVALRRRREWWTRESALSLALVGGIFVVGFLPQALAMARAAGGSPFLPVRGYGAAAADLLSYFLPGFRNSLFGGALAPAVSRMTGLPQEWTVYPGYVVLALAAWGWRMRRREGPQARPGSAPAGFFALGAIVFAVLSLGIYLKVGGVSEFTLGGRAFRVPLPFLALTHLPGLGNLRSPGRFGVMALLSLAPLMAAGLADLMRRARTLARRRLVFAACALLLAAEYVALPIPLLDARVPQVYEEIRREEGRFAVLEIPFGLRDGSVTVGREETRFQLYQTVHGRPILSGCVSRMREEVPRAAGAEPVLGTLLRVELAGGVSPADAERDRREGAARLRELGVKYVLVHPYVSEAREGPAAGAPGSGPSAEPARRYLALAQYLAGVLGPVERRLTPEGIVVLRLF